MAEQVRARVRVTGRVQGVFYRATCRTRADALGVTGRVANLADGSVEIVAQGAEAAVRELLDWAGRGPVGARVDEIAVRWEPPDPDESGFHVR